jgi:3-oxoacyl-[acyl-carrier-protein] synthase-3
LPKLEKTGFEEVYRLRSGEDLAQLAKSVLSKSPGFNPEFIDAVVLVSSEFSSSPTWVGDFLSAYGFRPTTKIFSIQDACTGYVNGTGVAISLVESGAAREVLVITADAYSKLFGGDVGLGMLFSDGLSCSVVSGGAAQSCDPEIALRFHVVADEVYNFPQSSSALSINDGLLTMHGAKVFQFAISTVPGVVRSAIEPLGLSTSDVDWFVHQGSRIVVEQLESALEKEPGSLFRAGRYGNTVGSSIPMQLEEYKTRGNYLGLVAFGMGLSVRVMIMELVK